VSALRSARVVIVASAVVAVMVVELLTRAGFTIADLVFAIYGAQLGLFPPVCLALFIGRERLGVLSVSAMLGISGGFIAGWSAAVIGRLSGNVDLVFLAPAISLLVSTVAMTLGYLFSTRRVQSHA
jgi:hypothetical protein